MTDKQLDSKPQAMSPNRQDGAQRLDLGSPLCDFADLQYKAIFDLLPCYIAIINATYDILMVNQQFKENFGEAVGQKCYWIYKGFQEKCSNCPIDKTFADRKHHIREGIFKLINGENADMITYTAPVTNPLGRVTAVIKMSTNITGPKNVQREFAFLGRSVATVTHDIKNILEGLQGGAYVVDEGLKDQDATLTQRGWKIVKKNIAEVSSLVQNILFAVKKRRLTYQQIEPFTIVRDMVVLFEERAKLLNVKLNYAYNKKLPPVNLNISGIRRILNNLIWNAMEACRKDEAEEHGKHWVEVRADYYDDWFYMFEVEDNGIGMDDETHAKLFTEHFAEKGAGEGSGLGLMVVDKIVKEHFGRVEVLTHPGRGTLFRLILKI